MNIESQKKRSYLMAAAVGLIPNLSLGLIFTFFAGSSERAQVFWVVFLGLPLLSFVLWIKNSLWEWAYFQFYLRQRTAEHLFELLISSNFPDPGEYIGSTESYLSEVVESDENTVNLRLKAMGELGVFNTLNGMNEFQKSVRMSIVWEDALRKLRLHYLMNSPNLKSVTE